MRRKTAISLPSGTQVPNHIAIIPDGNRRWARARGLHPSEGHMMGAKRVRELTTIARSWGVHTVTFWGLSTENWKVRSEAEAELLMQIIGRYLDDNLKEAKKEGVRIIHLGRKDRLPKALIEKINHAEDITRKNTKYVFNIALDYGGQDEILRAMQKMVKAGVTPNEVTKERLEKYLDTHDQPYPYVDLLIRTSGELRTSGLLLWQMDYAEMYWEQDHFPDFSPDKLREAIIDYSRRRRRFGGNDAMEHFKFKPEVTAKFELGWWRLSRIPEGTRFRDFARQHMRELYGLSSNLGKEAAKLMMEAVTEGEKSKWGEATVKLKEFYTLIKDELKLAFEPSLVASLEVNLWQKLNDQKHDLSAEFEDATRQYLAEMYRISTYQAAKAAHLRMLATAERRLAESNGDEHHWVKAQNYLELYYKALKDRVA